MQSRRDQVQAYRFVTRRIVSAMLSGEPETTDQPMRRLSLSLFVSAMVAVIVLAAAGVFGLLTNSSAPLEPNTLVIERETEARYVYLGDRLHPVLNYTSARLFLGDAEPTVRRVSRGSLEDIPRGHPVGIPDAPDSLPEPDALLGLPWRVCSIPPAGDVPRAESLVVVGREVGGAAAIGDQAMYVATDSAGYLLWRDQLLRINEPLAVDALGLSAVDPVPVGEQLVNAIARGPDLDVVRPEGFGEETDFELGGRRALVGFIYRAVDQHYVMTRDGLAPIGNLTVAIRAAIGASTIRDVTGAEANRFRFTNQPLEPEGFPLEVPQMHPSTGTAPTVCATYRGPGDGALGTTIEVFDRTPPELVPSAPDLVQAPQTARDTVATVDHALIAGGQGALVQAVSGATAGESASTIYLVTAQGIKYPLGTAAGDARGALGYGAVAPVHIPTAMVELLPTGPTLDIEAARQPVDLDSTGAATNAASGS